jgi:hypothetical protein
MSRLKPMSLMILLALALTLVWPFPAAFAQGGNLLANPGFEGFYRSFSYGSSVDQLVREFRVADGWNPWYRPHADGDPGWRYRRPEYRPASYSYNGSAAQQFFTSFGTHQAGLYQRVNNAVPGQNYRFSIAAYIWSSNHENFYRSENPGEASVRVGIDPSGGTNPYAASVVWSPFSTFYDEWRMLSVDATAQSRALTVFVWSEQAYPVVHNDVAVDEAYLGVGGAGSPATEETTAADAEEAAPEAPAAPAIPASPTGITLTPDVNVRMRATVYGQMLAVIPAGMPVVVLGRSEDLNWTLVEYEGQQGWVGSWLGNYSGDFESLPVVTP